VTHHQPITPLADMKRRVDISRADSDAALFRDLLALGELILKLTMLGLLAGLREEERAVRYGFEYELIRADSLGPWRDCLNRLINGSARKGLDTAARETQAALNTPVKPNSDAWQAMAFEALYEAATALDVEWEQPRKICGRHWYELLVPLRNRVAHGAPPAARIVRALAPLEDSLNMLLAELPLLQRPWFYVRRHVSGKARIYSLRDQDTVSSDGRETLSDGIYIAFDVPRRVPLLDCDVDLRDFWVPNGNFSGGRFESISYVNDVRRSGDGNRYLTPPTALPPSETQGLGTLEPEGQTFTNLPAAPPDYVRRASIEEEIAGLLMDDHHPLVTFHGGGGVGKTSLAITALHDIAQADRYGAILWFSARDVELAATGPKAVLPHLTTTSEIAAESVRLLGPAEREDPTFDPLGYFADLLTRGLDGTPLLFAFDNFETVGKPQEFFVWLDTYIRSPSKVIITTRERDFKADYPVTVEGMTWDEFGRLVSSNARSLGIEGLITPSVLDELYAESSGRPYVAKVLLGEIAQSGRPEVRRIIAGRDDILDALFERTYGGMTREAQRLFLCLSRLHEAPVDALEAVLLRPKGPRFDMEGAVRQLVNGAMLERLTINDDADYLGLPLTAATFGERKLRTSPLRPLVQADVVLLRGFGMRSRRGGLDQQIATFGKFVAGQVRRDEGTLDEYAPIFEVLARKRAEVWLLLADLFEDLRGGWSGADAAIECVRQYLEAHPEDPDAWKRLADAHASVNDRAGQVAALVEQAELPRTPFADVSYAAAQLLTLLGEQGAPEAGDENWLIDRLVDVMERRVNEAAGTDLGRLAWLLLNQQKSARARKHVALGLERDPDNIHLLRLEERLGAYRSGRPSEGPQTDRRSTGRPRQDAVSVDEAIRMVGSAIKVNDCGDLAEMKRRVTELGQQLEEHDLVQRPLRERGLPFAVVATAVNALCPRLAPVQLGFRNLSQLVQYCWAESPYCLVERLGEDPPQPWMALRTDLPPGTRVLGGPTRPEVRSPEFYRRILARGMPIIKPPSPDALREVAAAIVEGPPDGDPVASVIDGALELVPSTLTFDEVKAAVLTLVACDVFKRVPKGQPLRNQKVWLASAMSTADDIVQRIRKVSDDKLTRILGEYDRTVLDDLLASA
jgi:hypothetical protein